MLSNIKYDVKKLPGLFLYRAIESINKNYQKKTFQMAANSVTELDTIEPSSLRKAA